LARTDKYTHTVRTATQYTRTLDMTPSPLSFSLYLLKIKNTKMHIKQTLKDGKHTGSDVDIHVYNRPV